MSEVTKVALNQIKNFGYDAAEQEDADDYLIHHFVQTDAYREAAEGTKTLIIGRKGSGKSAIFLYLKHNSSSLDNTDTMFVVPEDISASSIRNFTGKGINEQASKTLIWKYLFLILIARFLINNAKLRIGDEKSWSENLRKVRKFLVDNDQIDELDMGERLRKFTSKIRPESLSIKLSAIGEFGIGNTKGTDESSQVLAGLDQLEKLILAVINSPEFSSNRLHIYIDQVDEFWLNDEPSNQMIIGLIMAAYHINTNFKPVRCVIFLRTDIYQVIEFHDKDKFHSSELEIRWDESTLKELISERIVQAAGTDIISHDSEQIFSGEINGLATLDYIISRTLLRPRELIQFCNISLSAAKKRKHISIEAADVLESEEKYSKWKLSDIVTEYKSSYPFLNDFLVLFEKRLGHSTPEFNREYFLKKYSGIQSELSGKYSSIDNLSIDLLLAILYNINFIGVIRDEAIAYKYSDTTTIGNSDSKFHIHPSFWKALGILVDDMAHKKSSASVQEKSTKKKRSEKPRLAKTTKTSKTSRQSTKKSTTPKLLAGTDEVRFVRNLSPLQRYAEEVATIASSLGSLELVSGRVLLIRTIASLEQSKTLLLLLDKRSIGIREETYRRFSRLEQDDARKNIKRRRKELIGEASEAIKICRLLEMSITQIEKLTASSIAARRHPSLVFDSVNKRLSSLLSELYATLINEYGFDLLLLDKRVK